MCNNTNCFGHHEVLSKSTKKYTWNWKRDFYIYPVTHDVLDKYEIADGVVNEDVTEYQPSKQYDLIFSIVTMQHVDRIKSTQDPTKIMKAMENLKKILSSDGIILIFHGLGENKEMDDLLEIGKLEFSQIFYLMKISKYQWAEAKWAMWNIYHMTIPSLLPGRF